LKIVERLPIRHERSGERGEFILEREGVREGELTYSLAGSRMTILHTEIATSLRGGGAARQLLDAAMHWAREENLKVASRCSYASAVLNRTPQHADLRTG
jgi:predicted GNAT family acetyltransferase